LIVYIGSLVLSEACRQMRAWTDAHVADSLTWVSVDLSIDDFGSGYSSLAYLKHQPVDNLKIDRAFVQHVTTEPDGSVIGAILQLAGVVGVKATAEGIETSRQLATLRDLDCPFGKEYLFSRPLAANYAWAFFKGLAAPSVAWATGDT